MASFPLHEIISRTLTDWQAYSSSSSKPSAASQRHDIDARLHAKLSNQPDYSQHNTIDANHPPFDEMTFNTVRALFRDAALALELELNLHDDIRSSDDEKKTNCHWVPGRIEVMGKVSCLL